MGKSVLLSKIRTEIRRREMSYRTEQAYIRWITRFIYYQNLEHPENMGDQEVVKFLNHLVTERDVSESVQIQAREAIHFLYCHIIGKPLSSLKGLKKGHTAYICQFRHSNGKEQMTPS